MILDEKVLVNIAAPNKKYYLDLGYEIPESKDKQGRIRTPRGTKIEVFVRDLPSDSHVKIHVSCDCCGKIITPTYQAYNAKIEKYGDYVCRKCENRHQKYTVNKKYGVDNISQLQDVKDKKIQSSILNYGTENVLQNKDIIEKIRLTNIARYGKPSFTQTELYADKRMDTIIEKYGTEENYKKHLAEEVRKTNLDRYGVDWYTQTDEYKIRSRQSFYRNGTTPTSSQQEYICNIYNGILNYPLEGYSLDIYIPDERIDVEADFGGHDLSVKTGSISRKQFEINEMIREKTIRQNAIRLIRIISPHDKMPSDDKLIEIYNYAKSYFETGHTWIYFYIEENKIRNAENCDDDGCPFDFGKLYNGKKLAKLIRKEVAR